MSAMLGRADKLRDWKGQVLERVRWHLSRREFIKAAAAGAAALAGGGLIGGRLAPAGAAVPGGQGPTRAQPRA